MVLHHINALNDDNFEKIEEWENNGGREFKVSLLLFRLGLLYQELISLVFSPL